MVLLSMCCGLASMRTSNSSLKQISHSLQVCLFLGDPLPLSPPCPSGRLDPHMPHCKRENLSKCVTQLQHTPSGLSTKWRNVGHEGLNMVHIHRPRGSDSYRPAQWLWPQLTSLCGIIRSVEIVTYVTVTNWQQMCLSAEECYISLYCSLD